VQLAVNINLDIILMEMYIKPLLWLGDSRRRVREFPHEARQRIGFEMWEVQQGREPSDWKPMPAVGKGVNEVRVHVNGEYRVLYVAKFQETVYVLHVFQKKTQQTSKHDIEVARDRYRELLQERVRLQ
jgi:phage-related protein